ncbi:DUF4349 domain-containing protein [Mucilaginibacter aquatilis]|uniref:DUF4349 domain-containing protein n=1 Tax=Mucilaginibacter aquatilis TaxID=1517760 RepID=A0A6I4I8M1_9SPHI|nr:DUF4349 domain-containing protein [Mucilaginibacter aquatilis]MVN90348.1 DUF4349 domain-containing protein [Mucilaginibacter aquatilis]
MKMSNLLVLLAVLCLFGACKGGMDKSSSSDQSSASADTISDNSETLISSNEQAGRKIVKTAQMRFKVSNVQASGEKVGTIARTHGGMITHYNMESTVTNDEDMRTNDIDSLKHIAAFTLTADITVQVPPQNLESFLNDVSRLGVYINVRKMDIEDKTLDYLSNQLKHQNRMIIDHKQDKWKPTVKETDAMLKLKDDMADEKVANARIDNSIKYSVVELSLYQSNTISQEIIANNNTGAYQLPIVNRLWLAITDGWELFASLFIGLMHLWVFVVLGIGGLLVYRAYKRKPTLSANAA